MSFISYVIYRDINNILFNRIANIVFILVIIKTLKMFNTIRYMNFTSDIEAKSPDVDPDAGSVGVDGPVFSSLSLIAFWRAYINLSNSNADRLCPLGIYKSIIFVLWMVSCPRIYKFNPCTLKWYYFDQRKLTIATPSSMFRVCFLASPTSGSN